MLDEFEDYSTPLSEWLSKCSHCGKDFTLFNRGTDKHFFCSPQCKQAFSPISFHQQQKERVAAFLARPGIDKSKYLNTPLPVATPPANPEEYFYGEEK